MRFKLPDFDETRRLLVPQGLERTSNGSQVINTANKALVITCRRSCLAKPRRTCIHYSGPPRV